MPLSPVILVLCLLDVVLLIWLSEIGASYWILLAVAFGSGIAIEAFGRLIR